MTLPSGFTIMTELIWDDLGWFRVVGYPCRVVLSLRPLLPAMVDLLKIERTARFFLPGAPTALLPYPTTFGVDFPILWYCSSVRLNIVLLFWLFLLE